MILEQLPPNITGLGPGQDPAAFKAACHLVARMEQGSVERFDLNLLARSYYAATIRTRTDELSVLCNGVYPYLAFVAANSFGPDMEFVAPSGLASRFSDLTGFQTLDADWLNSAPEPGMLRGLAAAELKDFGYWRPKRIGEVIFNHWD